MKSTSPLSFSRRVEDPRIATLQVKVVPGASRDRVVGMYGEAIKIQVAAPPEKGKANDAVRRVLADFLQVKLNQVELIAGHVNPRKQFRIIGLNRAAIDHKLREISWQSPRHS